VRLNFYLSTFVSINVTAASAIHHDSDIDRIFGPVLRPRTYRNLLYAVISFPLGLVYFTTMIVGLALGAGLAIVFVGFLILAVTLAFARLLGRFERELAKALLGATFAPRVTGPSGWRAILTDRQSWTTVVYLILRFPLGLAGFLVSLLFLVSVPVMAAPLLYTFVSYSIDGALVTTSQEALLVSLFGCVLFLLCIHATNAIASICRRLAVALL
jgi:hypothetical protein